MKRFKTIREKINAVKNAVREQYAWPGGYELFGITSHGEILCTKCMKEEFHQILWSVKNNCSDGWKIDAIGYSGELESIDFIEKHHEEYCLDMCAHCNKILNP